VDELESALIPMNYSVTREDSPTDAAVCWKLERFLKMSAYVLSLDSGIKHWKSFRRWEW